MTGALARRLLRSLYGPTADLPVLDPRRICAWALLATLIGVAQWYRTDTEQYIGVGYLWAASFLFASLRWRKRLVLFAGFGLVAAWSTARAVAGFWLPDTPWHSTVIIGAAWGFVGYLALERAWASIATFWDR